MQGYIPAPGSNLPAIHPGIVTTLAAGAAPTVGLRATGDGSFLLDLGIPAGTIGATGGKGADGVTPTIEAGAVSALAVGAAPSAAFRALGGGRYALDLGLPAGATGGKGADGAAGATPMIEIGNVATVAVSGAATAAVRSLGGNRYAVDIGIPTGAAGAPGVTPTIEVGNLTTVVAGGAATAAVRALGGGRYAVDLGLPAGAAGATPTLQLGNVTTVAAGGQATAAVRALGGNAYAVDLGIPTGAAGAAGANGSANLTTFRRAYVSSVELTSSNSSYGFAAAVPSGATEVEVECVGGGASGFAGQSDGSMPGHGGSPGQVARKRFRVADVPATVSVTVGAGAAASTVQSGFCYALAGGDTLFGSLIQAKGGPGGRYTVLTELVPGDVAIPGDVPTGRPGRANGRNLNGYTLNPGVYYDYLAAMPSMGPGGGGAGMPGGQDGYQSSGAGGASAIHLPGSTKAGGSGYSPAGGYTASVPGQNASDVWGYGSGGSGASSGGQGYQGGYPGGGGGGGGSTGKGGAGGRGAVRLHFYRYEAP